jgi:TM2 domain-containing membrane protein YozV
VLIIFSLKYRYMGVLIWLKVNIVQIVVLKLMGKLKFALNVVLDKQNQVHIKRIELIKREISLLIVGLGQVYNGQTVKGLIFFIVAVIIGLTGIGLIISFLIWLYAMYDAYNTAQRINEGENVGDIGSSS